MTDEEWLSKAVCFLVHDEGSPRAINAQIIIRRVTEDDRGLGWVVERITYPAGRITQARLQVSPDGDSLWWRPRTVPHGYGDDREDWCEDKEDALELYERWKTQAHQARS